MKVMTPLLKHKHEQRSAFHKSELRGLKQRRPVYRAGKTYRNCIDNPDLFNLRWEQFGSLTPVRYKGKRKLERIR